MSAYSNSRAVLVILDGFGIGKDSPFNAIRNARTPFLNELLKKYPHSALLTHGEAVGLPKGVMGNSEVGHMTMGAGRIIYQDLTRISKDIEERTFHQNPVLRKTLSAGAAKSGRVHLMGLLSDGGVHSHIDHLLALLDLCQELKVPKTFVHPFLDGRDTPPNSAAGFLKRLAEHPAIQSGKAEIASCMGRYYAMDRDKRWDRVKLAYDALTGQSRSPIVPTPPEKRLQTILAAVESSHQQGKTDEFVEPMLFAASSKISDGDSVIFYNYRSDRARELTTALTVTDFHDFERGHVPKLSAFAGMAQYDRNLDLPFAYGPQNLNNIFGEWLEKKSLTQFRLAETEKYAHVTFFFNGGREKPFIGEDRVLIPSVRDVATYDLKPEMSAFEIADEAAKQIERKVYNFMVMNFANADMVGHTGNYSATLQAIEVLDQCLAKVIGAAERSGYDVLLTADHGNAEEMCAHDGVLHTQHTLNPVPAIWIAPNSAVAPRSARKAMLDGSLEDIMPTLCQLMNLPIPEEVTGKSLIPKE
ncbi:MAG: 2,3-bisphosphoglycerate-independent phosphoglycerate mutase [Methylotenera sp.]|nr:2,3-bisphosphoglycerate-independent phosphoglycerate mutase [Oligoflexia bacterium]